MAVPPLRALHAAGHDITLVVTRPDKRRGRGSGTSPSPVKAAAIELAIPVSHQVDDVLSTDAELGVVVAFGQIIKPHVLEAIPMVNLHFSLLPRWRGAAPVERALMAGDAETGVCVMAVEEGLDTGGIYARSVVPIGPTTTADELRDQLVDEGTRLLVELLDGASAGGLGEPLPQVGEPTYADKIDTSELELVWERDAAWLHRLVRVGGAYTTFRGERFKVHEADHVTAADVAGIAPGGPRPPRSVGPDGSDASGRPAGSPPATGAPGELVDATDGLVVAGDGAGLRLRRVQPAGKAAMSWRDYANGARPRHGERFGA